MSKPTQRPEQLKVEYESMARDAIRELLENKHLYQSVTFGSDLKKTIKGQVLRGVLEKKAAAPASGILVGSWTLNAERGPYDGASPVGMMPPSLSQIGVELPRIKTKCPHCGADDAPHIPFGCHEYQKNWTNDGGRRGDVPTRQAFSIKYVCQSCPEDKPRFMCFLITSRKFQ